MRAKGTLLCFEPKMHVSKGLYSEIIRVGEAVGFKAVPIDEIGLNHFVLFGDKNKPPRPTAKGAILHHILEDS